MPTVKQTRTHDMLQLRVSYAKGTSLLLTCSRNGESVRTTPEDFATAIGVASLVTHIHRRMRDGTDPAMNYGVMMDRLEAAAKAASGYADFVARGAEALACPQGLPAPATGQPRPRTLATHKTGRSQTVHVDFASGENLDLTISAASCGVRSDPSVCVIEDRIARFALAARSLGHGPAHAAKAITAHAERTPDLMTFLNGLNLTIFEGIDP